MTTQTCVLCRTTNSDGTEREPNLAAQGRQVCTGHYARAERRLDIIVPQWGMLSAALGSGNGHARVSGTAEPTLGVSVPVLDLIGPANTGTVSDPYGDQTGHASIASILRMWVIDWADARGRGERGPDALTVDALVTWLRDRLPWAVEEIRYDRDGQRVGGGHPALLEFADDLARIVGALRTANGDVPDADDHRHGIECPRCDLQTLYDTVDLAEDFIECLESRGGCGKLLKPSEYHRWVLMKEFFLRASIPCPQCGLAALAGARRLDRVECLEAKGGCGATIPWQAYDKWVKAVAAIERAGIPIWGHHHPLPGPALQNAA
ncbi:hypothetical protein [Glycomyces artemisiae]|uniref:Uncharacterized protein n=1 Tax=Glycomyces artemisiae TaxID=1076443 RepID=A0A2T0UF56_9ACTN|nr:hypothetical protein [Glycomyces artemisiae]PRY56457.1 hypothetical protein B0I28_109106 [Glycomyces artemisiae]